MVKFLNNPLAERKILFSETAKQTGGPLYGTLFVSMYLALYLIFQLSVYQDSNHSFFLPSSNRLHTN
jgi:hypothetical protein